VQLDLFDAKRNEIVGASTYTEFRRRLLDSACRRCTLCEGRTHIVADRGSPDARIMVIGEGPGEQEDLKGEAFVGKAGKLLDKIMSAVDLDTNRHMLIVNVVKCRPPENRTPRQDEVEACLPFLQRQIALVKPRIVLLLGATSLKHIDPSRKDFSMANEAGKFFTLGDYPGVQFMVLYHPAALLYNARLKSDMWAHVQALRDFLKEKGWWPHDAKAAKA
jgi:DNA polymerase